MFSTRVGRPILVSVLVFMLVFFVIAIGLQYNDPDPWQWVAFYGSSALLTLWSLTSSAPKIPKPLIGFQITAATLYFIGEAINFYSGRLSAPRAEVFSELGGLAIVISWSFFLLRRSSPHSGRPPQREWT